MGDFGFSRLPQNTEQFLSAAGKLPGAVHGSRKSSFALVFLKDCPVIGNLAMSIAGQLYRQDTGRISGRAWYRTAGRPDGNAPNELSAYASNGFAGSAAPPTPPCQAGRARGLNSPLEPAIPHRYRRLQPNRPLSCCAGIRHRRNPTGPRRCPAEATP